MGCQIVLEYKLSKMVFEYAKRKSQYSVCLSGPEFPTDNKECRDYLLKEVKLTFCL